MGWVEDKLEKVASTVTLEAERTRTELGATFATSLRGSRMQGALSRPVRPNASNYGSAGRLVGWSLRAGAEAVTVTFRDGRSADADAIATVVIPAGQSDTTAFPPVSIVEDLFVEVSPATGGAVFGSVWIGAVD